MKRDQSRPEFELDSSRLLIVETHPVRLNGLSCNFSKKIIFYSSTGIVDWKPLTILVFLMCHYFLINLIKMFKKIHHHQHLVVPPVRISLTHLSLPLPIVHRFWQVLRATSRIPTELMYVGSSWSPCFWSAMCGGPLECITHEPFPASPAVPCMSDSSNSDNFRGGWLVAV